MCSLHEYCVQCRQWMLCSQLLLVVALTCWQPLYQAFNVAKGCCVPTVLLMAALACAGNP